jgi:hypothetical protein
MYRIILAFFLLYGLQSLDVSHDFAFVDVKSDAKSVTILLDYAEEGGHVLRRIDNESAIVCIPFVGDEISYPLFVAFSHQINGSIMRSNKRGERESP